MGNVRNLMTEIADKIREKEGSTDLIKASDFPSRIANLSRQSSTDKEYLFSKGEWADFMGEMKTISQYNRGLFTVGLDNINRGTTSNKNSNFGNNVLYMSNKVPSGYNKLCIKYTYLSSETYKYNMFSVNGSTNYPTGYFCVADVFVSYITNQSSTNPLIYKKMETHTVDISNYDDFYLSFYSCDGLVIIYEIWLEK